MNFNIFSNLQGYQIFPEPWKAEVTKKDAPNRAFSRLFAFLKPFPTFPESNKAVDMSSSHELAQ